MGSSEPLDLGFRTSWSSLAESLLISDPPTSNIPFLVLRFGVTD